MSIRRPASAVFDCRTPQALCAKSNFSWCDHPSLFTLTLNSQAGRPIDRAEVIVRWHANEKHPRAGFGRAVRTTFEMRSNPEAGANMPSIRKATPHPGKREGLQEVRPRPSRR